MAASLPYHEPGIEDILILSSFLLALNLVSSVLDKTLYCGLVGQVLIGVAWGTPGGKWLSESMEESIVQLGYLGLIMIVFEGGLATSVATMKANLLLSVCVALTGIAAPMALSFFLAPMVNASHIQCFAAGAALCSTSLGTTFTVLSTSGLASTRLGSVLSTAAMMDDVVGLVMVQIVSSLGSGSADISPVTVVRPVLVSVAFAILVPLACRYILTPLMPVLEKARVKHVGSQVVMISKTKQTVFVTQSMILLALVTGASYAGASVLLAAYLAGIIGSYWDDKVIGAITITEPPETSTNSPQETATMAEAAPDTFIRERADLDTVEPGAETASQGTRALTTAMYEHYYFQSIERVLKPFFFASIGFSIPISMMFSGAIVWRGIIYTILMLFGKALCGLWLIRFSPPLRDVLVGSCESTFSSLRGVIRCLPLGRLVHRPKVVKEAAVSPEGESEGRERPLCAEEAMAPMSSPVAEKRGKTPAKPLSLYPAGIMSCAMIARGEIGFLISSVAESNAIFRGSSDSTTSQEATEMFLIITWAIVLCTIIGPLCVGLLVRRVKRLEATSVATQVEGTRRDVLGAWGIA